MSNRTPDELPTRMTRRQLLRLMGTSVGASAILAACGGAAAPAGDTATSAPAAAAPTAASRRRSANRNGRSNCGPGSSGDCGCRQRARPAAR